MAGGVVAVQMGPRNRRRLRSGASILGTLAIIGAGLVWLDGPSTVYLGSSRPVESTASSAHLVYGMRIAQVRRLTGRATSTQGNCWLFAPKNGVIGSLSVSPYVHSANPIDKIKLCFDGGQYSEGDQHMYYRGHWHWISWPLIVMGHR